MKARRCPPGCKPSPLPCECTAPTHASTSCGQTTITPCSHTLSPAPTQAQQECPASPATSTYQTLRSRTGLVCRIFLPQVRKCPDSPACPGEPGRAEPGVSKGCWCPLLSQKIIGAAESTSGTCHPGQGAEHTPLWAAGVGTGLSLAGPRT